MTDTITGRRIAITDASEAGFSISLPYSSLDGVRELLEANKVPHYVEEEVFSKNGGPEVAFIDFPRKADPVMVQHSWTASPECRGLSGMALAQDIRALADRVLSNLDAIHDYYTYSKRVWRQVKRDVDAGDKFSYRNPATGTSVNERSLVEHSKTYVGDYLASSTFQHFVSLFEDFVFGLLRHWLAAYPATLSKKQIDMAAILKAPDKAAIILTVVDKELNEVKYERLADWFAFLERLTKIGCPTAAEVEQLAEIKASRDVLVHNSGFANAIYLSKSGGRARCADGERLEIPEPYHRESWQLIGKVVRDISAATIAKAQPEPS